MSNSIRTKLMVLWLVLGIASIGQGCRGQDTVVRMAKSQSGNSAAILAYKDSIFGTYSADLVIRAIDGRVLVRTNLLEGRDSLEDIPIEFLSLKFEGHSVYLEVKSVHYRGPTEFKVE